MLDMDRIFELGSGILPAGMAYQLGQMNGEAELEKALTTGSGIVADGATGGQALREQWLEGQLRSVSYEQKDHVLMQRIPHKKAKSVLEEYTTFDQYGSAGDGFSLETGNDGAYNGTEVDDSFTRRTRSIKFMSTVRGVGRVARAVDNIADPWTTADKGATLELIGKANLACYYGDSKTATAQYDGMIRQIVDWVTLKTECQDILIDAGGAPVDSDLLADAVATSAEHWGEPSLFLQSIGGQQDTEKALFPALRGGLGDVGAFGVDKKTFKSANGPIALVADKAIRPGHPLYLGGAAITGKPKATADTGAVGWTATPWTTCAATTPGPGNYWQNVTTNDQASVVTKPNIPSALNRNRAANRLSYANHYYAASVVYKGLESLAWVYGAAAANTVTSATAVPTTSTNSIVGMTFDYTQISGLGTTYARNMTKIRVYRCDKVPTAMSDFDFLFEVGFHTATAAPTAYDNGYNMPGTDDAFLITETKGGLDQWMFLELLSMLRVALPPELFRERFGYLMFGTPWLPVPSFHIHVRNVGKLA